MSLCTGGGTKKSTSWNQMIILTTLNLADKLKILLFEFIFFDTKPPSQSPSAFPVHTPRPHPGAQPRTGYYGLAEKVFSEAGY